MKPISRLRPSHWLFLILGSIVCFTLGFVTRFYGLAQAIAFGAFVLAAFIWVELDKHK